jgi:hypothetical protein
MTARLSDERLQEIVNGALPTFKEETKMAVELVARRQQLSGIAQRSAEKIADMCDSWAAAQNAFPRTGLEVARQQIAAIIEQEGKQE